MRGEKRRDEATITEMGNYRSRFVELTVSRNIWGKGRKALGRGGSHATRPSVEGGGANYVLDP